MLQSDFATFSGGLNRNSLVEAWSKRKPVREVFEKPVESAKEPEEAARCQDTGICKAAWRRLELPTFKFTNFKKSFSGFLRQRFAAVHGRQLLAKLLCFDGSVADVVHVSRLVWLSFANGSPVFHMWGECVWEPETATRPPFPFHVDPKFGNHVESELSAAKDFPSVCGSQDMHKSTHWISNLLTSCPALPLTSATWRVVQCGFRASCLSDPDAPVGQLEVIGTEGETVVLCHPNDKPSGKERALNRQASLDPEDARLLSMLDEEESEVAVEPLDNDSDVDVAGDDFDNGTLELQLDDIAALELVAEQELLEVAIRDAEQALDECLGEDTFPGPAANPAILLGAPSLDESCVVEREASGRVEKVGRVRFWGDMCMQVVCGKHKGCNHQISYRRGGDVEGCKAAALQWLGLAQEVDDGTVLTITKERHQELRRVAGRNALANL